jgi:peptidoglycan/LPS O-acetylase OafA/YrhL
MAQRQHRLGELDGLRGIAALMVVAYHYTTRYDEIFGHHSTPLASLPLGYLGVELFFILSGLVIVASALHAPDAGSFGIFRFARLYPAYWVAVIATFVVLSIFDLWPHSPVSTGDAALNLTMLQEFFGRPNVDGAYWTLRVEMLFYALIWLALTLRVLRHVEWIVAMMLGVTAGWVVLDRAGAFDANRATEVIGTMLHNAIALGHLPFFIAGMVLCRCWRDGVTPARIALIVASIVITAAVSGVLVAEVQAVFVVATALAAYGALPLLRSRLFSFFGWVSYSLYLLHQYIGYVVIHQLEARGISATVAIVIAGIVVLVLATALSRWIEYPGQQAIRSWYAAHRHSSTSPDRTAPATAPPIR